MSIYTTLLAIFLCVLQVAAFKASVKMSTGGVSRRDFFAKSFAGAAAGAFVSTSAASAANYFGDKDKYPGVVKPSDAVIDQELLGTDSVKNGIESLKKYSASTKELQSQMAKDGQAAINSEVRKTFEVSKLRCALNDVNVVFDEDTQRGTDRLIRDIIQDVFEVENVSRVKEGVPRSTRKIETINKRLQKLDKAFTDVLAFF